MLIIESQERELFDEATNKFIQIKTPTVRMEHSLISISKWESIFQKPFIYTMSTDDISVEELKSYIRCMIIGDITDDQIDQLWMTNGKRIVNHIESPRTATTIHRSNTPGKRSRELVTSELIYYWMVNFNIPFTCERWHINRLLTLIDVCNVKQNGDKKRSRKDTLANNAALNKQRKAALKTRG